MKIVATRSARLVALVTLPLFSFSAPPADAIDSEEADGAEFFYYDYTARDREVVDYQNYALPGVSLWTFRGPRPALEKGRYFSAIGAAQTLGVLIQKPYPTLLAEELGLGSGLDLGKEGYRLGS